MEAAEPPSAGLDAPAAAPCGAAVVAAAVAVPALLLILTSIGVRLAAARLTSAWKSRLGMAACTACLGAALACCRLAPARPPLPLPTVPGLHLLPCRPSGLLQFVSWEVRVAEP